VPVYPETVILVIILVPVWSYMGTNPSNQRRAVRVERNTG